MTDNLTIPAPIVKNEGENEQLAERAREVLQAMPNPFTDKGSISNLRERTLVWMGDNYDTIRAAIKAMARADKADAVMERMKGAIDSAIYALAHVDNNNCGDGVTIAAEGLCHEALREYEGMK